VGRRQGRARSERREGRMRDLLSGDSWEGALLHRYVCIYI